MRALITKDPHLAEAWYTVSISEGEGENNDKIVNRHVLNRAARYGSLEMLYVLLAALRKFGPGTPLASPTSSMKGVDGVILCVVDGGGVIAKDERVKAAVKRQISGGLWPCLEWSLSVANAGSIRKWRGERAREMLFLRRLVLKQQDRKRVARNSIFLFRSRSRATENSESLDIITLGLFLLRDDALFLRCLKYCWFVDLHRHVRQVM